MCSLSASAFFLRAFDVYWSLRQVKEQRKKVIDEGKFVSRQLPQLLVHSPLDRARSTCVGLFDKAVSAAVALHPKLSFC